MSPQTTYDITDKSWLASRATEGFKDIDILAYYHPVQLGLTVAKKYGFKKNCEKGIGGNCQEVAIWNC